jgi:hypothetical protein
MLTLLSETTRETTRGTVPKKGRDPEV